MPDHIHTIVGIPPTMSVSKALQFLKGASLRELFKMKPHLRCRYHKGHFWSPGKFYRSVGNANDIMVNDFFPWHNIDVICLRIKD